MRVCVQEMNMYYENESIVSNVMGKCRIFLCASLRAVAVGGYGYY